MGILQTVFSSKGTSLSRFATMMRRLARVARSRSGVIWVLVGLLVGGIMLAGHLATSNGASSSSSGSSGSNGAARIARDQPKIAQPSAVAQAEAQAAGAKAAEPPTTTDTSKGAGDSAANNAVAAKVLAAAGLERSMAVKSASGAVYSLPISPTLQLPAQFAEDPVLKNRDATYRQYGFNLAKSNALPLNHPVPDLRSADCRSVTYPPVDKLPKVSVIIIFYNEVCGLVIGSGWVETGESEEDGGWM